MWFGNCDSHFANRYIKNANPLSLIILLGVWPFALLGGSVMFALVRERLIGCSSFFVKPSCSIQKNDLDFDQKTQLVQFIRRFIRRAERVRRYEWKGL